MKVCKNPTCDRRPGEMPEHGGKTPTYCSAVCRHAMRTATKGRMLGDLWLPMSLWWKLKDRADLLGVTPRDLVMNLIESELLL